MPKPKGPQIVTGNDLRSGDVVFWTGDGWSGDYREARVLDGAQAQAEALEQAAADHLTVVGPYLAAVGADTAPTHFREWLRTLGPTVRPDLGKQSQASA